MAPAQLLAPGKAAAATTEIEMGTEKELRKDLQRFQGCVNLPQGVIESSDFFIDMAESVLVKAQDLERTQAAEQDDQGTLTKKREQAINDLEEINVAGSLDRAEGEAKCQAMHPPEGGTGEK